MRWYKQGAKWEETVELGESILKESADSDYLTRMQCYDRLVRSYILLGDPQNTMDNFEKYVWTTQMYFRQKADETLQEMETRFKTAEKQKQIERRNLQIVILILVLLLVSALAVLAVGHAIRVRRRNEELKKMNQTKEELLQFLSKDLANPSKIQVDALKELSLKCGNLSTEEIRSRCEEIARQASTINNDIADYLSDILVRRGRGIADTGLTKRELEVVRMCADGLSSAQIAERLFVSVYTVNRHRQNIYSKLGVKNVTEMIRKARELGII